MSQPRSRLWLPRARPAARLQQAPRQDQSQRQQLPAAGKGIVRRSRRLTQVELCQGAPIDRHTGHDTFHMKVVGLLSYEHGLGMHRTQAPQQRCWGRI